MADLLQFSDTWTGREASLTVLMLVVAALFILTLAFSAYAVALRMRNKARDLRRAEYTERWREKLLLALADQDEVSALRATIRDDEGLPFVGFAVQYARRMRGAERDALRGLVRPYLGPIAARADSRSVEVRARAIQTLGMLGLPEHAPRVMKALDDPSPLVAMVAARALAQEESPDYAAAVLARLSRFQGWDRHFLAAMLAAMGPHVSGTFRDGLADARAEPTSRAVLAEVLQLQGDFLAGDVAAAIIGPTTSRELLASTLRLLREVGRPEHAPSVRALCASPDVAVRAEALRTLGALGGEGDVPVLLTAMEDASPWVALNAARGVREAGGTPALAELAATDRPNAVLARQVLTEERAW